MRKRAPPLRTNSPLPWEIWLLPLQLALEVASLLPAVPCVSQPAGLHTQPWASWLRAAASGELSPWGPVGTYHTPAHSWTPVTLLPNRGWRDNPSEAQMAPPLGLAALSQPEGQRGGQLS